MCVTVKHLLQQS